MKSNIFIPKTIRVGYQNRTDTYTGKLAYIIYIDAQGKVRKEASWKSWRDDKIEPTDFANEPTSGFVLNKKAGGYSTGWNHRQTYTRVYDPRGFEFEISIPNLLYILENTSAIKGKGLEGEFVYGWDGTDLILMPTSAPDYAQLTEFAEANFNKETITGKNIILGATYKTAQNEDWVYLGRYDEYDVPYYRNEVANPKNKGKRYWFKNLNYEGNYGSDIQTITSLSKKIIKTVDPNPVSNYAELMDEVEGMERYAPYDPSADKLKKASVEQLKKISETLEQETYWGKLYLNPEVCYTVNGIDVVSTLSAVRERDAENKDKRVPVGYYLSTPMRRIPPKEEDIETKYDDRHSYSYYGYDRSDGWTYDYDRKSGGRIWKRDKAMNEITKLVKPYTEYPYNKKNVKTLEELENKFGFYLREKYLTNGKRLDTKYDDSWDWDDDDYDEDYETEENKLVEATNG